MNHFKWKRFAIVYDLPETGGFYVKVWIQFRCQLKSVFHRSEDKRLHQFVVYPAQLSNLFFMLPLSDISVFSLTFELVANLPLMIFVLSRKNAFTKATDYAIFDVFFFFGGGGLVFFSFWEFWTLISVSDTNFKCFSSHRQGKFWQTTMHWEWRKLRHSYINLTEWREGERRGDIKHTWKKLSYFFTF